MSQVNKDPAILYYPKDWLSETHFLTFEDKGKLADLRALFFEHGRLTNDKVIKAIGSLPEALKEFIKIDENKLYYCPAVEEQIKKRKAFKYSRSKDGSKGNRVKEMMKERNVTKEEAREILTKEEGLVFGKDKYSTPRTGSVRNKENAIGNVNADENQLDEILFKQEISYPLSVVEKEVLARNGLNYVGQFDNGKN